MQVSRREFLKRSAAVSALGLLPETVLGANDRLNVAFVGIGGKGNSALRSCKDHCNIVAFADVDDLEIRSGKTRKLYPDPPLYRDFRVMLDKHDKDIDAVVVSTPDHTHHYIGMTCLARGKHVYVEKPLAHNIAEVRDFMAAEKKTGLVCQMGNQGHSGLGIKQLRAWVEEGILGDITEVRAWPDHCVTGKGTRLQRLPAQPIPERISWDLWLGPAAYVPFNDGYCPGAWRHWNEFGGGALGDFACHNMDAPFDALGLDCPSAVKIESTGPSQYSFPESSKLTFTFDSPQHGEILLKWYEGKVFKPERPADMDPDVRMGSHFGGAFIMGSKATVMMGSHASSPRIVPFAKHKELKKSLPKVEPNKSNNHHLNWILACKGEGTCRSPFSYGGRLTEAMMYGLIAMRVNRNLTIDPRQRTILGDDEAVKWMGWPSPRQGWDVKV